MITPREELRTVLSELDMLTRGTIEPAKQPRINYLLAKSSALKEEIKAQPQRRSAFAERHDLTPQQEEEYRALQEYVLGGRIAPEFRRITSERDEVEQWRGPAPDAGDYRDAGPSAGGAPIASTLIGNLGAFVPNDIFSLFLVKSLRMWDPLFDEDKVTFLKTEKGNPLLVPVVGGVGLNSFQSPVLEGGASQYQGPDTATQFVVRGFTYRSPLFHFSREAFEDMDGVFSVTEIFKQTMVQRLALGAGRDLMIGSGGVNGIKGLITIVKGLTLGLGTTAVGSSGDTGGTETGRTTVGTKDLAALFASVDRAYRMSPKCAWMMNDTTAQYIRALRSSSAGLMFPDFDAAGMRNTDDGGQGSTGVPMLYGKPVYVSPSMDDMATGRFPIAFGDMSYWLTRCTPTGIQRFMEIPNTVEKGAIGMRAYARFDGTLMYSDAGGNPPPIRLLQNA